MNTMITTKTRKSAETKQSVVRTAGPKPVSVLMLDGHSNISMLVARCLGQSADFRLHVLSSQTCPPLRFSRHYSTFHKHPPMEDHAALLEFVESKAAQIRPGIILPVEDTATEFASSHQQRLRKIAALPPLPQPDALRALSDKDQLAEFCQRAGVPTPSTVAIKPGADLAARLAEISFPALLKPVRGRSGSGIRRFEDAAGMLEHLEPLDLHKAAPLIAQSVVPGHDVDCSFLCRDGEILAHTIQRGFLPRGGTYQPQAGIEFIDDDEILESARKLVHAARLSGVAHLDFRRDDRDGRARLVDVNIRFWGSLLGSLHMGVNFPELACQSALGLTLAPSPYRRGRYVDFGAVLKQTVRRLTFRSAQKFTLQETGLKYVLSDPGAEAVKLARQLRG